MKRLICAVLLAMALPQAASAQYEQYLELLRSDLKAARVQIFTEVLTLTDAESTAFWPIYRQYETDLSALGDKRIALIKDYAANYTTMTNEKAQELLNGTFSLLDDRSKVWQKYAKEFAKVVPVTTVARFFQAERFVTGLVDLQIMAELPLIETVRAAAVADSTKK